MDRKESNSIVLTPAREQVAVILKKKIVNKELLPGDTINLRDTAAELGVSSMPVREALQILSSQGFVELHANKPAVVIGISKNHVRNFFETLTMMEREVAGLAALRSTDISELEKIFKDEENCLKSGDLYDMEDLNYAFHRTIRDLSDNEYLARILDGLWSTSARNIQSLSKGLYETYHRDHKKIITAIKNHDVEAARNMMEMHMLRCQKHASIKPDGTVVI